MSINTKGRQKSPRKIRLPPFPSEFLIAIAKVLGDTTAGLKGTEIAHILKQCKIQDIDVGNTKWKRLHHALQSHQIKSKYGNFVVMFIEKAMAPVRYTSNPATFDGRRDALNDILVLSGMTLGEDGKMRPVTAARTLKRANSFQAKLKSREVHDEVLGYCSAEILSQNYFHAVFEAMKSLSGRIRSIAKVDTDGQQLVNDAFSFGSSKIPRVAINPLTTSTQRGEQHGFISLLKGLYGTVRNPLAHEPKIDWEMSEQDALDIMCMISLIHRKLDGAHTNSATRNA